MKLHLPVSLRKFILSCIVTAASSSYSYGAGWSTSEPAPQNLTFDGATLTWNTSIDNPVFLNADDEAVTFESDDVLNIAEGEMLSVEPKTSVLSSDATTLQMVLLNASMKNAVTITTRRTGSVDYQNYDSVTFKDISYAASSSYTYGGAISGDRDGTINLSNNGSVVFISNTASSTLSSSGSSVVGGAIFGDLFSSITLNNNGNVEFCKNTASSSTGACYGGAICGDEVSVMTLSNNGSVKFSGNIVNATDFLALGGAICGFGDISLNNNGSVVFEENSAISSSSYAEGGAMYGTAIMLKENESVAFVENRVSDNESAWGAHGGAIYASNEVNLQDNGKLLFYGNEVISYHAYGGAIASDKVKLTGNSEVSFLSNEATALRNEDRGGGAQAYGGALYGRIIDLSDNDVLSFVENSVKSDVKGYATASGGAIYLVYSYYPYDSEDPNLVLSNNGDVCFSGNIASSVDSYGHATTAAHASGGAIYGCSSSQITLSNNESLMFYGNTASAYDSSSGEYGLPGAFGGAICTAGNLSIQNNDSVEFYQNAEIYNGVYRLRSLYVDNTYSKSIVALSTAEGKDITFRDSIYIVDGSTFNLNSDYVDATGNSIKQKGDILFTGATTVDDLYIVKGNVAGTEEEIMASRTSEINAMTNLYGGRLRVEDGAIYQGRGITAHAGSSSTVRVKDAALNHAGYDLTFNAGTTLELEGANSIAGNVQMLEGSTIRFICDADTSLSLTGSLNFGDSTTMQLVGYGIGNYELLTLNDATVTGMDSVLFIDGSGNSLNASRFTWLDNSLYYVNGEVETLTWTNATGDGMWNNVSENWAADGTAYAVSTLHNVAFSGSECERITVEGRQLVNSMTVQGESWVFAESTEGASLHVVGTLNLDARAVDIQLAEGVRVDGSLRTSSGSLKVNKITGKGHVNIWGGSIELADDVNAIDVDGRTDIWYTELRGTWTVDGLSILVSRVAADASVTLKNVSLQSTLSNAGNLMLGGRVIVNCDSLEEWNLDFSILEDLDTITRETRYSAGESGYAYRENSYILVTGTGSTSALPGTQWIVQGDAELPVNATYSYINGVLHATGAQDKTQYWVNSAVTYDGRSEFSTANTLVLNGGNLIMTSNLDGNLTGGIRVDAAGTLTLGSGVQLSRGDIRDVSANKEVTLQGAGSLNLGASAAFTGYELGNEWKGTIKLANISTDTNLDMKTIGQVGSTIELENVMGYTGVNSGTVDANLVLTRSYAANGAELPAFHVSNGYSNAASDYVMTSFSGTVSGAGKIKYDKTLNGIYTGFAFTGNVAGWTGSFEMNAGKTFNLVFGGSATIINAAIRDISKNSTLNLVLQANDAMRLNGDVVTDSIRVTNSNDVSFYGTVNTGSLNAANSNILIASVAEVSGDMTVGGLQLQSSGRLIVGGMFGAGDITLDSLSSNGPSLTVGQFGAGDTIFHLDIEDLNALELGHGESVAIARADNAIGSDFNVWLGEGSTSLDAAVYRYDISVSGTDVQVSKDYANWGSRVWYRNAWVGQDSWDEYLVAGYDAVDGIETVDMGTETLSGVSLLIAPASSDSTTVLSNGEMFVEIAEVVDGRLQIAADAVLDATEMTAEGKEIHLLGELALSEGQIGKLSGTTGKLSIAAGGVVSIDSSVTLSALTNSGTLDIGSNKLNVASAVTTGGNVLAGEVVVHNRANKAAVFNALVADKVTVTNSLNSSNYKDVISLGDGSAIGELSAETLEVRNGTVSLGATEGSTELTLQGLDLQNDATLLLNRRTQLTVTESMSATKNAIVQLKQGAGISYGATTIRNGGWVETTTVNAYELASGNLKKVENAYVTVDSNADSIIDFRLINATLEKYGKGSLTVTSDNNSINAVLSFGGCINVMNVASYEAEAFIKLVSLELHEGAIFGAYVGSILDADAEASVQVTASAVIGSGARINADLELMGGCRLTLHGPVKMGSDLTVSGTITLDGDLLDQILSAESDSSFVLFSGIDNLYLNGTQYESISLSDMLGASVYFAGLNDDEYRRYLLTYDSSVLGEGVLSVHVVSVPEPTTATLSLLALVALAARRRRK